MKTFHFAVFAWALFSANVLANNSVPDNRHIAIRGSAQLQASPDSAKITFEVSVIKPTALAAKQEVDNRVNALLAGMDRFAINNNAVTASNLLTEPDIQYDDNDTEIVAGYAATRTIKVILADLSKLNEFIDFALSVEINEIEDIDLISSNEPSWREKATAAAVEDAKSRATLLAKAFGAKVGSIYSINAGSSSMNYGYTARNDIERIEVTGSRYKPGDAMPGRYLQATITFSASIDVVFDLDVD